MEVGLHWPVGDDENVRILIYLEEDAGRERAVLRVLAGQWQSLLGVLLLPMKLE